MSYVPPRSPASWGDEEWDLLGDLPPIGGRARAEKLPALPDAGADPEEGLDGGALRATSSGEDVIAALVADLNPPQREAVLYDGGPLVVVAGAGSGKTRVLTRRIARLVASGVAPWRILAITFTNKAADEMRRRVVELVGPDAERMWVSTFHAACVRMLRRNIERIGYRPGFSIYDDGDSRRLVEHVLDDLGIDHKRFPPRAVLGAISTAKSDLVDAYAYAQRAGTIYERKIAEAYNEYERRLVAANAMDFDDLLVRTVRMFRDHPDVLEQYSERFEHVLVDEYQDTNVVQNELVIQLGEQRRNVCVVGDTDQSIYRFRGAEMRNLLEFERAFPDARLVVLDQNYRSSQTILDAANAVIGNNLIRQKKDLWSALGKGERIRRYRAPDDRDEAWFVTSEIATLHRDEAVSYSDIAVFYRTNAQSRALETALADRGIAYSVIGGTRFSTGARSATSLPTCAPLPIRVTRCRCVGSSTRPGAASATRPSGASSPSGPRAESALPARFNVPRRLECLARPSQECGASSHCSTSCERPSSSRTPPTSSSRSSWTALATGSLSRPRSRSGAAGRSVPRDVWRTSLSS